MSDKAKYEHFYDELKNETDRGVVILAAAMVDELLKDLLLARLAPTPTSEDSLVEGTNAPFSSLNSKTDGCYRLGLISAKLARDINLLRKMRNEFAHSSKGCNFEDQSAKSRVQELSRSLGVKARNPKWAASKKIITVRDDFVVAASGILAVLEQTVAVTESVAVAGEEWIYSIKIDDSEPG